MSKLIPMDFSVEEQKNNSIIYFTENKCEIINDIKESFGFLLDNRFRYTGFKRQAFDNYLISKIKSYFLLEKYYSIDIEEAMVIASDPEIIKLTNEIIKIILE